MISTVFGRVGSSVNQPFLDENFVETFKSNITTAVKNHKTPV